MLHVLSLRYTTSEQEAAPFVTAHVDFLERHHRDDTFLVSGQTVPPAEGGAIVACGIDRAAIGQIISENPFVVASVAKYMITTIDPGRVHPALTALPGSTTPGYVAEPATAARLR